MNYVLISRDGFISNKKDLDLFYLSILALYERLFRSKYSFD